MFQEVERACTTRIECYALVDAFIIALDHQRLVWTTFSGVIIRRCVSGRHPSGQERKQLRISAADWLWEKCARRPIWAVRVTRRLGLEDP